MSPKSESKKGDKKLVSVLATSISVTRIRAEAVEATKAVGTTEAVGTAEAVETTKIGKDGEESKTEYPNLV